MAKLAFYTFAVLEEAFRHQHSSGFVDRITGVLSQLSRPRDSWGVRTPRAMKVKMHNGETHWPPRASTPGKGALRDNSPEVSPDDHEAATLSLWDDLESVYAFAYYGRHAEALKKREDWFVKPEWPSFVAWWVENGQIPTWEDACSRLELLNDEGPTPHAFDFKTRFDSAGTPWRMDRSKIQEKSDQVKMFDENNPTGI